jgi:ABC-type nickel/cobalt efflux system permease component RcnA
MDGDVLMFATVLRELGQQVWQSNIAHSLKQFVDAVTAIFAMALSTAITTGALATMAALAMDLALRLTGGQSSRRGEIVGRALEFAAACLVLALVLEVTLAGV